MTRQDVESVKRLETYLLRESARHKALPRKMAHRKAVTLARWAGMVAGMRDNAGLTLDAPRETL